MEEFLEEQEVDLATAIAQYEKIKGTTERPWFCCAFDLQEHYGNSKCNFYYEECMATFLGENHNAKSNAELAVASVNLVPRLIARIRELEAKTATELSEDVINAIDALNKWRNRV
jgi:hypothetical protein